MKIYRIYQHVNRGYDTYDSAVVVAENEEEARHIHPSGFDWPGFKWDNGTWTSPENVKVEYIGETHLTEKQIIVSSFNAG